MEKAAGNAVNNEIYNDLGERWYTAKDDPVALLRAESRSRNVWVLAEIRKAFGESAVSILDVGCGAGFLSNELARHGYKVTGLDASQSSLMIARQYDTTGNVTYESGNAYALPYEDASVEVVCAMDFLEHVDEPGRIVAEVARVLKPGGQFFFHTFNRNLIAWLIVIKGVEWFVKNTPPDMHILRLFVKPSELREMCEKNHLRVDCLQGFAPKIFQRPFWRMIFTGTVDDSFEFHFTKSTLTGYTGLATKR